MSDDVLVRVENVSKRFCRSLKRSLWYGLQDLGSEIGGSRHDGGGGLPQSSADVQLRRDEFWAVKDICFELRKGEALGLIGKNGAGKTTLLRMLNGLIKPDTGRMSIRGRVGALIALGAGFNPVLSGRENIYINSSILGMTKQEVDSKIDQIIDFAEISESIDSPVQTYSTGMQVRLGFSVAATIDPDLLILDEVLAVGDMNFNAKCWNRLGELRKRGCSFIIVSHQMINIERLASKCLLLDKGRQISASLEKYDVIRKYDHLVYGAMDNNQRRNQNLQFSKLEQAGSGRVSISSVIIIDGSGQPVQTVTSGHPISIRLHLTATESLPHPIIEITISGNTGTIIQANSKDYTPAGNIECDTYTTIELPAFPLCNDALTIAITLWDHNMAELYDWTKGLRLNALPGTRCTGNVSTAINWFHNGYVTGDHLLTS